MAISLNQLEELAWMWHADARPVFEDAVRSLSPGELEALLLGLTERARSDTAQIAARALITASRTLAARGLPNLIQPAVLDDAAMVLRTDYEYRGPPDRIRSTFRIAADTLEPIAGAVRWASDVAAGIYPRDEGRRHPVYKDGRIVARGGDLQTVTRYAKRAGGAALILLERRPDASGVLHLYYADGATLSTAFASFDVMHEWLQTKRRYRRTSWLAEAPVFTFDADAWTPLRDRDGRRRF